MTRPEEWLHRAAQAIRNWGGASRRSRCVVLIDGDAVSPLQVDALVRYAGSQGRLAKLEVYSNFLHGRPESWNRTVNQHGISAHQLFRSGGGKNAADVVMIVRAMELRHQRRFEHFVLATGDTDFSALAHGLRRSGATVHIVGPAEVTPALRNAGDVFVSFDDLERWSTGNYRTLIGPFWHGPPASAEDYLLQCLVRLGGARDWVSLDQLRGEIVGGNGNRKSRHYRHLKLHEVCAAIDSIELGGTEDDPRVRIALRRRNGSVEETGPMS